MILLRALLLAGLFSLSVRASAQLPPEADTLFRYDASSPLEFRDSLIETGSHWKVYDVSYASPRTGRVTGYLVAPSGNDRHAGILFGHWDPGNRTEFLPEAKLYAQAGAVCLMIDYPWARPAPWQVHGGNGFAEPEKALAVFSQAVVDLRRGLDVLAARRDVDAGRLGYVGHSYGAQWGAILAAVDDRVSAAALMCGVPSDSVFYVESQQPNMLAMREGTPDSLLATYLRRVTVPLAAITYAAHAAPTPLFFQFARKEREFSEAAMNRYYDAASEPKSVKWYDTGHELNDPRALVDRARWMAEKLGLDEIEDFIANEWK